jgi:hypothetical protein
MNSIGTKGALSIGVTIAFLAARCCIIDVDNRATRSRTQASLRKGALDEFQQWKSDGGGR